RASAPCRLSHSNTSKTSLGATKAQHRNSCCRSSRSARVLEHAHHLFRGLAQRREEPPWLVVVLLHHAAGVAPQGLANVVAHTRIEQPVCERLSKTLAIRGLAV